MERAAGYKHFYHSFDRKYVPILAFLVASNSTNSTIYDQYQIVEDISGTTNYNEKKLTYYA